MKPDSAMSDENSSAQNPEESNERGKVMSTKDPVKIRAYELVRNAINRGDLVRLPCACGEKRSQAHHHDYSKPLDVEWLCSSCHNRLKHPHTPERNAAIRASIKPWNHTEEAKRKIGIAFKGRKKSDAQKANISAAIKTHWKTRNRVRPLITGACGYVDRPLLGPQEQGFVPLPITDDRPKDPDDWGREIGHESSSAQSNHQIRLEHRIAELEAALAEVLPYMEAAESEGLVGHEGCHWPVEIVRAALKEK